MRQTAKLPTPYFLAIEEVYSRLSPISPMVYSALPFGVRFGTIGARGSGLTCTLAGHDMSQDLKLDEVFVYRWPVSAS